MKQIGGHIAICRGPDGFPYQQILTHYLRNFMRDRAIEVVLARRYPVAAVVVERKRVAEPDPGIDDTGVREQTQSFLLDLREPIRMGPADRVGDRHIAEPGGVVPSFCVGDQGVSYCRVTKRIEKPGTLAESPRT